MSEVLGIEGHVLSRAKGFCEGCGEPAPFSTRDGTPYLEVHYVRRLTDEGPCNPEDALALCPTCHRLVHFGVGGESYDKRLADLSERVEMALQDGRLKFVSAAVLFQGLGDVEVLMTKRARGHLAGKWEFPGGKLKEGESPEACIRREIKEELELTVSSLRPLIKVDHDYGDSFVRLFAFTCKARGSANLHDHLEAKWLTYREFSMMDMAPADIKIARKLMKIINPEVALWPW